METLKIVLFFCLLSLVNGGCDQNPLTRRSCFTFNPITDRTTCESLGCCFDDKAGIPVVQRCYRKGLSFGSFRFGSTIAPRELKFGGTYDDPHSILLRNCSKPTSLCISSATYVSKTVCERFSCCFIDGACYKATFNVIRLGCPPGYAGSRPSCRKYKLAFIPDSWGYYSDAKDYCRDNYNGHVLQFDPRLTTYQGRKDLLGSLGITWWRARIWIGISRDSNDVWRRDEDQSVFPISDDDWDPAGFPLDYSYTTQLVLVHKPSDSSQHAFFRDRDDDGYVDCRWICEYV